MAVAGMATGHISVQAFNLVRETGILEKVECTVDRWGFGCALSIEICQEIVGFRWLWTFQEQLQHFPTYRGQALPPLCGHSVGLFEKLIDFTRTARPKCVGVIPCVIRSWHVRHISIVGIFLVFAK